MGRIELSRTAYSTNFVYLIKCLIGVIICYLLYKYIPQYPFYWAIVSVVVALSPDDSNQQAYDRMKANVLGCTHTLRSALAALVIVTIQEELEKHWYLALERVICVVAGCLVALMVTMLCNSIIRVNAKRLKPKA